MEDQVKLEKLIIRLENYNANNNNNNNNNKNRREKKSFRICSKIVSCKRRYHWLF